MKQIIYDGSFDGFLCAVMQIYQAKYTEFEIVPYNKFNQSLLGNPLCIPTQNDYADRVFYGIRTKLGPRILQFVYQCFLSESTHIENKLVAFIRLLFETGATCYHDFGNPMVRDLHHIRKMVSREVHRMHAFVRFQLTNDQIYTAICNPDFNVLPLAVPHFKKRYPAMDWLIYDFNRSYGIFYSQSIMQVVSLPEEINIRSGQITSNQLHPEERNYQALWQAYFQSVNIRERTNTELHKRHVPRRYWKYLVEKW